MTERGEILVSPGPGEVRYLLLSDGQPLELVIDRPGLLLDSVFRGRVVAIERGLDSAFVDLGQGERPGFLPGAKAGGLSVGDAVSVRVRAEARGGKGPLLTLQDGFDAFGEAPSLLRRSSPLQRLLAANPGISRILVDDAATLAELRPLVPEGVTLERGETRSDLDEVLAAALDPVVPLPSGGRLVIETTAALTTMDVDSGSDRPSQANEEAVSVLARQVRLRGLGGQMVVDFVSGKDRKPLYRLAEALKAALAADPIPSHVFGVTALGLVELTRERRAPCLAELLCRRGLELSDDTLALAALRALLAEALARPGLVLGIAAAPQVIAALGRLETERAETERRLGRPLMLRAEPGRGRDDVLIEETRS
ncbi:MAG: ribonuclease E/G [Magnetospirillum sp.]|nr:ribonuclease E/G [Magnetospirillum sp.]